MKIIGKHIQTCNGKDMNGNDIKIKLDIDIIEMDKATNNEEIDFNNNVIPIYNMKESKPL